MYVLDKDRARDVLLEEKRIPPHQVEKFLDRFPPLHAKLGEIVDQWLDTQTIPNVVIDGISLEEVTRIRHCHFLVAVRDLNKILDPNLSPEKRDQWRKILTTPVYYE